MATPETFRALLAANAIPHRVDLSHRTKNLGQNVNQFLYKHCHEPSLAAHRIQEHVYKTVPLLRNEQKVAVSTTHKLNGVCFDLDYTASFLNQMDESIQNSIEAREIISELASKKSSLRARRTPGSQ